MKTLLLTAILFLYGNAFAGPSQQEHYADFVSETDRSKIEVYEVLNPKDTWVVDTTGYVVSVHALIKVAGNNGFKYVVPDHVSVEQRTKDKFAIVTVYWEAPLSGKLFLQTIKRPKNISPQEDKFDVMKELFGDD